MRGSDVLMLAFRRRLRDDSGWTLVELMVGSALGLLVLIIVGTFLMNMMNGSVFALGETQTINDVRNAMQQIEKEARGADSLTWCSPTGFCLEVDAQTPTGGSRTVRYQCPNCSDAGSTPRTLTRQVFDSVSHTWGAAQTVIQRVTNSSSQAVFACDTQSTLLRVILDLYIEPTPKSDPNLHVVDSFRPRNFPAVATCP
jgi:type II secretory pathway pseudopilin PulG